MRLLIVAIAALGLATGVGLRTAAHQGDASGERASLYGTIRHSYASVGELAQASDVIIVGQVIDQVSLTYGRLPFTQSRVAVAQALKGAQVGDVLSVVETGGVFRPTAKDGSAAPVGTQIVDFEGVPVTNVGWTYVLFLRTYAGDIATGAYVILSEFQGKFPIVEDRIRFAGAPAQLSEPRFAVLRDADGNTLPEFLQAIVSVLR